MKTATTLILTASTAAGFSVVPSSTSSIVTSSRTSHTVLHGLFDGVKDAFSAPAASQIDQERETPIDRWMGWSVVSESEQGQSGPKAVTDFVDSMDEQNYVSVMLTKPMGIVFEENESEYGGIFVQSLKEGGAAAENGTLQPGDQLVVVGTKNVSGMEFDDALGAILDSEGDKTKLTVFRGKAKQFYGPTGPSKEWLESFCEKGGVVVSA